MKWADRCRRLHPGLILPQIKKHMSVYLYGVFSESGSFSALAIEQGDAKVVTKHPVTGVDLHKIEVVGSNLKKNGGLAKLLGNDKLCGQFFVLDPTTEGENIAFVEGSTTFPFLPFVEQCYHIGIALPKAAPGFDISSN